MGPRENQRHLMCIGIQSKHLFFFFCIYIVPKGQTAGSPKHLGFGTEDPSPRFLAGWIKNSWFLKVKQRKLMGKVKVMCYRVWLPSTPNAVFMGAPPVPHCEPRSNHLLHVPPTMLFNLFFTISSIFFFCPNALATLFLKRDGESILFTHLINQLRTKPFSLKKIISVECINYCLITLDRVLDQKLFD